MELIEFIKQLVSPEGLNELVVRFDTWIYVILFLIVFCETGLVVTPFLPGDSMLFAIGAVAAFDGSPLSVPLLAGLLIVAAILGDAVNYSVGHYFGPRVFRYEDSWLLNKKHLLRTQRFYEKHGGKTIVLARFMPIIRTFAPFVAGIGEMRYWKFALYNVTGGIAWVLSFLLLGYWYGNRPWVKENFTYVIIAIVILSVLPIVWEFIRAWRHPEEAQAPTTTAV
jgi:membrane-associated protein